MSWTTRRLAVAVALAILSMPASAQAAPPPDPARPAASGVTLPASGITVQPACGPAKPGAWRCYALRRTDIAALPASAMSPGATPAGYGPADVQSAYALPSATAGSGLTVAVVAAYDLPTAEADLAVYRAKFGLPACTTANGCFRKVDQRGGNELPEPDAGWGTEIALDIEMVSATCPKCRILLVEADSDYPDDLLAGVDTAVALGAIAVSNSYGAPEDSNATTIDSHLNHPGVAIVVSSGDNGYGVEFPASSQYVIAVGGTSLRRNSSTRGWTESAWGDAELESGAGSGCSQYEAKPYWQQDAGCANRSVADVAAVADPATGVAVYDSTPFDGVAGWQVLGGTSASTPIIASVFALAGRPDPGTLPASYLYAGSAGLYDVTSGSNDIWGDCVVTYLCNGVLGYDGPTGLGTPHGTSAFVPPILPAGYPGIPTHVTAAAGNGFASVAWSAPDDSGIGPITGYTVTSSPGAKSCTTTGSLTCRVTGLTNSTPYTFTVTATNLLGASPRSAPSSPVTPMVPGTVAAWGWDSDGQVEVPPDLTGVTAISAGECHSLARKSDGTVVGWGGCYAADVPSDLSGVTAISAGAHHSLALKSDGTVVAWGCCGSVTSVPTGLSDVTAISAGDAYSLAVKSDGTIVHWGDVPTVPAGISGVVAVAAGPYHSLALKSDGTVVGWGWDGNGQTDVPAGLSDVTAIAAGGYHSLALKSDGTVVAWGYDGYGQTDVPAGLSDVTAIGAGFLYSLALKSDGTVVAWGNDDYGETDVPPLPHVAAISAGYNHGLALVRPTAPGAPTSVAGLGYNSSALISWTAPSSDGGTAIAGYSVVSTPDGKTCETEGELFCTVAGLSNGTPYTFTVTATNDIGPGPVSAASAPVTPAAVPGAPTGVSGVGFDSTAAVSWTAPADNGTGPITGYTVTASPDGRTCTPTGALTCIVSGLTNHTHYTFRVTATNAVGTGPASVASGTVTPRIGATFVPLTPNRLVDSHLGLGLSGRLRANVASTFQVTGRVPADPTRNVPANATAVTGVLSVSGATYKGWLSLTPEPNSAPTTSTINFPANDARATGVTVVLGSGGTLSVTYGAPAGKTADMTFDVTGYFVLGTSGLTFVAVTPNRLVDSRSTVKIGIATGPLTAGTARTFQVTGRTPEVSATNVPSQAVAVTGTLTVTGQTAAGYLTLGPDPLSSPPTASLFFPKGDNRATGLAIKLGGGGTLSVTFIAAPGAKTDVVFDVTGYFVPGTSGATYVPVTPNRLVDSRSTARIGLTTALRSYVAATFQVTGRVPADPTRNVPSSAVAVTGTLTVTGQSAGGWLSLTQTPINRPTTSSLNFLKGDNRATGVTVPLGSGGNLSVTYGGATGATTHVVFDVTGYFLS